VPSVTSKNRARSGRRDAFDLASLNPRQLEAVLHDDGPLLVLAGAGSGKTRVIIYRITRLIRDGVDPAQILGVTFTNKAAREMRQRLIELAGARGAKVQLSTFHSLGLRIIREEQEAAGLRPGFCIYDSGDQVSLVRDMMRQIRVADRRLDAARVLELILRAKRERRANLVPEEDADDYAFAAAELYPRYVAQMRAFNAVDFDDLILRAQDVLDEPAARGRWRERFRYILVDEYQDTSPDQLMLLRGLAEKHNNICVVGDDDQSIYAWRGAAAGNILEFSKQFRGTREVVLDQNYRSTNRILEAANAVIRNNPVRKPKNLWSAGGAGDAVEVVACGTGDDEAAFVVETIQRLLYDGTRADEVAILYRANVQSRAFEELLALERVPFRVVGGQAFFERKEVRDAIAYLSVVQNPSDEVSLRRIINTPPRGIGVSSVERLSSHGEKTGQGLWGAVLDAGAVEGLPGSAVAGAAALVAALEPRAASLRAAGSDELATQARDLFEALGLRDAILTADDASGISTRRLENLDEVVRSLELYEHQAPDGPLLAEFLRSSALTQIPRGGEEKQQEQVTLMTLHSAKGLEFNYVFLVGVEEDALPHRKTVEEAGDLSEERRLCYVGMTRARKRLWLTWARQRRRYGKLQDRAASRFLAEIPDGPGVERRNHGGGDAGEESEALAQDFFAKMRGQLGIED
jgi:DNA helicase-2/ATP-dependent DNA helicase PcrA